MSAESKTSDVLAMLLSLDIKFVNNLKHEEAVLYVNSHVLHSTRYTSVSQPSWDRGPVNSFFVRRGPGSNKFTRN